MQETTISTPISHPTQEKKSSFISFCFSKPDLAWMLSLYGTAIGAGILYLPIEIGLSGFIPVFVITLLAFPSTFFAHRNLARLILAGKDKKGDISHVMEEYAGTTIGRCIVGIYFAFIFVMLLVYCIALTNNVDSFLTNLLGLNISHGVLSFFLIGALCLLVCFGKNFVVKIISMLVIPFIAILVFFSFSLIPHWSMSAITDLFSMTPALPEAVSTHTNIYKTLWLTMPLMVFSFNYIPIVSPFAVYTKETYPHKAEQKTTSIMFVGGFIMAITALFFVFSCLFTLPSHELLAAKHANLSVLDYLAIYLHKPFIRYLAVLIAFVAIGKAFLGHFLGAREIAYRLLQSHYQKKSTQLPNEKKLDTIFAIIVFIIAWIVATWNLSVIHSIEVLAGPLVSLLLFVMPVCLIYIVPSLRKYKSPLANLFVFVIGLIAASATTYSLFF